MYATSHRVLSPSGKREGINVFLSLHQGTPHAGSIDWGRPSVEAVAEQTPGVLSESDCDIPPGGNTVRSYLDVVARDGTPVEMLGAALDAFERQLSEARLPFTHHFNQVGIRFGAVMELEPERVEEFQSLRNRLLRFLERTAA
ncbi:hypothetical protein JY651_28365 [Pyxidicoccus parkwayensis]|uniref:Uncharacterized protein n=1 Tax=Pyxidicoccus parkwayensis TaxID=2813578 RepID=A0ABX7NLF8_9BACT|nr:hypothetical protein [Pyxidicoccus parkwaysis]QSQ19251.1 hypothetical protein JY651_28365 [Pyxidicoccus parkwaysis]